MIKLSCFLPTNHLEDFSPHLDYDFLEPVNDPRYINFYKARDDYKLLDNGMIEFKESVSPQKLYEYMQQVNPTHVVPPDRLGDWKFNQISAESFLRYCPAERMLVTLGGPSPQDFSQQASECILAGYYGVCLPYRRNRVPVQTNRQHLFGLRIPEYFADWSGYNYKTTLDTTEPIAAAMRDIHWVEEGGIVSFPRPKDYIERRMTPWQVQAAISNIHYLKEWIAERSR